MSHHRIRSVAKRKTKQREKSKDQNDRQLEVRHVLSVMGLNEFGRLYGEDTLLRLFSPPIPRPRVIPDPGIPSAPELKTMARKLQHVIDNVSIRVGEKTLSFPSFISYGLRLYDLSDGALTARWGKAESRMHAELMRPVKPFFARFERTMAEALNHAVMLFLSAHSRIDGPTYSVRKVPPNPDRGFTFRMTRTGPESILIEQDGSRRRAYRCKAPAFDADGGVALASWDAGKTGLASITPLPVYVQQHAIDQVVKRLPIHDGEHGVLHYLIWRAMDRGRPIATGDDRFLVEVGFSDTMRVGYLVAERLDGKILVKTFLLPAMSGTPEARRLYELLRLRRSDIEYLGLSDIKILAGTDLLEDGAIAAVLEESGCGGLMSFVKHVKWGEKKEGYANSFKAYLGRNFPTDAGRIR